MIVVHTVWDEEEEEEGDLGDDGALHWVFALLVRWRRTGCVKSSSVETRPNARGMTVKMNFFFFFLASWLPCVCVCVASCDWSTAPLIPICLIH